MSKEGGVEVKTEIVGFGKIDPVAELIDSKFVAIDFFAVGFSINVRVKTTNTSMKNTANIIHTTTIVYPPKALLKNFLNSTKALITRE